MPQRTHRGFRTSAASLSAVVALLGCHAPRPVTLDDWRPARRMDSVAIYGLTQRIGQAVVARDSAQVLSLVSSPELAPAVWGLEQCGAGIISGLGGRTLPASLRIAQFGRGL